MFNKTIKSIQNFYKKRNYTTWDKICKKNPDHIHILWYGSLLNEKTLTDSTKTVGFWIAYWFKTLFSCQSSATSETYWWQRNLTYLTLGQAKALKKPFLEEGNNMYLNSQFTWGDNIAIWRIIKINNKDFNYYKEREKQYKLYPVNVAHINPKTGDKLNIVTKSYILVNDTTDNPNWMPYEAYKEVCRLWAKWIWKFVENVFLNNTYLWNWKDMAYIKTNQNTKIWWTFD